MMKQREADESATLDMTTEEHEGGGRKPSGAARYLVVVIALGWSLFQLWFAQATLNDTLARSVHLAFAMALAYLAFPISHRADSTRLPWWDLLLALLAGMGALYLFLDYEGIAMRPGLPLERDLLFGVVTMVLLMEATRRTLGPALAVIGLLFLLYAHFGPYMPSLLAHRGASLNKIISHMYLTTEGIFGVPLRVSTSFVFLFVLFGAMLERAGAGRYFIQLAYAILGGLRGGPAKAAVAASGLTGMISGSSIANTVTTGTFTIPLMKKVGFTPEKAAAVEVAASTNGQLMPPIMGAAAFIIAEFLGIAYLDVIKAAFIPAIVSYMGLFYVVHLEASKLGLSGTPRSQLPSRWKTLIEGLHHLIPVAVLIYTLAVLEQSATQAAFNAILTAMTIIAIQHPLYAAIHKQPLLPALRRGMEDIYHGLINGARHMVPIGIATAAAGIVVGTVTLTGLGQRLLELIELLSMGHLIPALLLTALTSLILGMGLPTTANYIVMATLTAPIILELGASNGLLIPAIAAHMFVFYFGILADDTPPVGLAAYAAAGIARSNPIQTGIQGFTYDMRTAILPFMFLLNTDLLLIEGVKPGGFAASASDWIWIEDPWLMLAIFATAMLGMFAFVSAVMGWNIRRAKWPERALLLVISFGLFRPDLLAELLNITEKRLMWLPPILIYGALALFKWRGTHQPDRDDPLKAATCEA
ncbi:MAG: TRAP transporter permease [Magnetococcales bacterium]|nr:TRAP transporter permease [Magnetococcales bacterium]